MKNIIPLLCTLFVLFSCNTQDITDNRVSSTTEDTNISSNTDKCEWLQNEILKELNTPDNIYGIYWKYGWDIDEIFYSTKTNSCVFTYSFMFEKCSVAEIGFCDQTYIYILDYSSKNTLVNGLEADVSDFDICEWAAHSRECNYQESIKAQLDSYR